MTESSNKPARPERIEFFFDPICPYAYQTSLWIRDVATATDAEIVWRFFSLEETNLVDGKKHPWERDLAYGWSQMRVAAWLRRQSNEWCGTYYDRCGRALHVEGRRPYDRDVALELLRDAGLPEEAWDEALADPTTHDDVRADHEDAVGRLGGFGVPIIVVPDGRAVFGPVIAPAPPAERALELWDVVLAFSRFPGLYEIKTPKTGDDLRMIGELFSPYLEARQWRSVMNPAP